MASQLTVQPARGPVSGTVRPPGSKSITNRALVCAALARDRSTLTGALASEDTRVMIDALGQLGIPVQSHQEGSTLVVRGCAGRIPAPRGDLFVANSGTTIRFLTALVTLGEGTFRLHGAARMHERPIQDLLDALTLLGADARSEQNNGCPPVCVSAAGLAGGRATVRGDVSSQFLSGILMASPYAREDVRIAVAGELVSKPYVRMTCQVMRAFGIDVPLENRTGQWQLRVPAGRAYRGRQYAIEPDASAASYFWAAAAITGGRVTVAGLSAASLQGDVQFCNALEKMGCRVRYEPDCITVAGPAESGIDIDMADISDTVQTLAVVGLFANSPTVIRGVGHIRHKETDRIGNLARELRKLGGGVKEHDDGLSIAPGKLVPASIDTYNDHRMAMSLALAGLRVPGVVIRDPDCTRKTYPAFFDDLVRLCKT